MTHKLTLPLAFLLALSLSPTASALNGELVFNGPTSGSYQVSSISISAQGGAWKGLPGHSVTTSTGIYQPPGSPSRELSTQSGFHLSTRSSTGSNQAIMAMYKVTIDFTGASDFVFYWDTRDLNYWNSPANYGCTSSPDDIDILIEISTGGFVSYDSRCDGVGEMNGGDTISIWDTTNMGSPDQNFETPFTSFTAPSTADTWESFTVNAVYEAPLGFSTSASFWVNRKSTVTGLWTGWTQKCANQASCGFVMDSRYGTMHIRFDLTVGSLAPISITKVVTDPSASGARRASGDDTTELSEGPAEPFPNPTVDRVTIPLTPYLQMEESVSEVDVQVFDRLGRIVFEARYLTSSPHAMVDSSRFPSGSYRVLVSDESGVLGATSFAVVR